jgi:hypothetical protein
MTDPTPVEPVPVEIWEALLEFHRNRADAAETKLDAVYHAWEDIAKNLEDDLQRTRAQLVVANELNSHCICYNGSPENFEGAQPECPIHGAIRAFHEASRELAEANGAATAWEQVAKDLDDENQRTQPVLDAARHIVSGWKQILERGLTSDVEDALDEAEHQLAAAVDALDAQLNTETNHG